MMIDDIRCGALDYDMQQDDTHNPSSLKTSTQLVCCTPAACTVQRKLINQGVLWMGGRDVLIAGASSSAISCSRGVW